MADKPKTLFQKINLIKLGLAQANLKKSGKNKFANYDYYQLEDFLPTVIQLMNDHGVTSKIDFKSDCAVLTFIDADDPEKFVTYESPTGSVEMKGVQSMQNLGAAQTYLRRYLYMNALDITEGEALDSLEPSKNKKTVADTSTKELETVLKVNPVHDEVKVKRFFALGREVFPNMSAEELKEVAKKKYKVASFTMVDNVQLDEMIKDLEARKK